MTTALGGANAARAAALLPFRGDVYGLLAGAFAFPDRVFYESMGDGRWEGSLMGAIERLPYVLRTSDLEWRAPRSYDDMQTEYIRLFQVGGRRGPPCPLHEGHYRRDRSQTLHSAIRFYNFFGFRVAECVMPDHLSVELEFMSEVASGGAADLASRVRAQRDFLRVHLSWVPELAARVSASRAHAYYRSLSALSQRLVKADQLFINETAGACDG